MAICDRRVVALSLALALAFSPLPFTRAELPALLERAGGVRTFSFSISPDASPESLLPTPPQFSSKPVLVELLRDVAFHLTPVTDVDAQAMLNELRAAKLLDGDRGMPPGDRAALADVILRRHDACRFHRGRPADRHSDRRPAARRRGRAPTHASARVAGLTTPGDQDTAAITDGSAEWIRTLCPRAVRSSSRRAPRTACAAISPEVVTPKMPGATVLAPH